MFAPPAAHRAPPRPRGHGAGAALLAASLALLTGVAPSVDAGSAPAAPAPRQQPHVERRSLPTQPNVVLITADDMRPGDLQAMPFLSGVVARHGVRFTDSISPYSLCCPARAEIVSGQYSHNNGVRGNHWPNGGYWAQLNPDQTLPVWLQAAGYRTAFVGKYMNGYGKPVPEALEGTGRSRYEIPPGWDHWYASVKRMYSYIGVRMRVDTPTAEPDFVETDRYQTRFFSDISDDIVRKFHRSGDPFFLWYSSATPHTVSKDGPSPPIPEPIYRHRFDGEPLPFDDEVFREAFNEDTMDKAGPMHALPPIDDERQQTLRREHENRLESLLSLDDSVRRLWRRLETTGELDATVLIFTSDNGYGLGAHRWRGKDQPYDSMLRVPMIVSARGLKQRYEPGAGADDLVTSDQTVTTLDVPTTIKALSEARTPWLLEGVDMMWPEDNPDHGAGVRAVLIESGWGGRRRPAMSRFIGVRTDRWTWLGWDARARPDATGATSLEFNGLDRWSAELGGWIEFYDRRGTPSQVDNIIGTDFVPTSRRLRAMVDDRFDCRGRQCVWDASTWQPSE